MCSCCSPSSWHKIDKNLTIKPKIEVLRIPSGEHEKFMHLIEGGIQLQAKFKHIRCNDYVSCNSLDENIQTDDSTKKYPSRISCYSKAQRSAALATKSCDNIYSKQVRVTDPDLTQWTPLRWGDDSTRSAETLCNNNSNANLSTRSRLLAFFKKLSPRPKRSNRNKTRTISGQSLFLYDLENKTSNEENSGFFESEHSLLFEKITRHKSFDQSTIVEILNPPEQMPTILIDHHEDENIASPNDVVISTEW